MEKESRYLGPPKGSVSKESLDEGVEDARDQKYNYLMLHLNMDFFKGYKCKKKGQVTNHSASTIINFALTTMDTRI
jgi:hypothetical protein